MSFVVGDRLTQTGLKLWDRLKDLSVVCFATDHWRSYAEFIPPEQHCQSKAETDASLYEIREYFKGRDEKGRMNTKVTDVRFNELDVALRSVLKKLAEKFCQKCTNTDS